MSTLPDDIVLPNDLFDDESWETELHELNEEDLIPHEEDDDERP